jgi:hypothetical protein
MRPKRLCRRTDYEGNGFPARVRRISNKCVASSVLHQSAPNSGKVIFLVTGDETPGARILVIGFPLLPFGVIP